MMQQQKSVVIMKNNVVSRFLACIILACLLLPMSFAQLATDNAETPAAEAAIGAPATLQAKPAVVEPPVEEIGNELDMRESIRRQECFEAGKELIVQARNAYADRNFYEAEAKFRQATTKLNEASEYMKRAGESSPIVKERIEYIRRMQYEMYVDWAEYLMADARRSMQSGQVEEALDKLTRALEYDPGEKDRINKLRRDYLLASKDLDFKNATSLESVVPDAAEINYKIKELLQTGKVQLAYGRYPDARDTFETVLLDDPYNLEAIRYLARISSDLEKAATAKLGSILAERLAEVRWKWAEPVTPLLTRSNNAIGSKAIKKTDMTLGLRNKLESMIIPQVKFQDTPLSDVFAKLRRQSQELDPEDRKSVV